MGLLATAKQALWKPSTVVVLALVLLWNYAFSLESVKRQFPYLVTAQLIFHQALSYLIPAHSCHLVTMVEIDDDAYRRPPISMRSPTNRSYLGTLIRNAADADAAAIVLDFNLASSGPQPAPGEDPEELQSQDKDLFDGIQSAINQKIPVVLATVLVDDKQGHWKRLPNIYTDSQFPLCSPKAEAPTVGCVAIGHINLPVDKRQIALQMEALDWSGSPPLKPYDSLALATSMFMKLHSKPQ